LDYFAVGARYFRAGLPNSMICAALNDAWADWRGKDSTDGGDEEKRCKKFAGLQMRERKFHDERLFTPLARG
jgi:hypothetical protein